MSKLNTIPASEFRKAFAKKPDKAPKKPVAEPKPEKEPTPFSGPDTRAEAQRIADSIVVKEPGYLVVERGKNGVIDLTGQSGRKFRITVVEVPP